MYLKWYNTTIGIINGNNRVKFLFPNLNLVVSEYTKGQQEWSAEEFREFLADRVISKSRRDIEKILYRCKIVDYDVVHIAKVTKAINAKDLLWISQDESETMENAIQGLFDSIFVKKVDTKGDSLNSPDGQNIKRYGISNGYYGLYKQRLNPFSTDVESEVGVYNLSRLLGVNCCPAWLVDNGKDVDVFSKFEYNFADEFIVHFRRLIDPNRRLGSEYRTLVNHLPAYKLEIQRMIVIDFITRQDDRHLSNMAQIVTAAGSYMYSLYDNGRSLFYEDKDEFIEKAISNIELYSTEFGHVGTYLDAIIEIAQEDKIHSLVNLNISEKDILKAYTLAGLKGNRLDGATTWTNRAIKLLKSM